LTNINALPERIEVRKKTATPKAKPHGISSNSEDKTDKEAEDGEKNDAIKADSRGEEEEVMEAGELIVAGMAHAGMVRSAKWLQEEIGPALDKV